MLSGSWCLLSCRLWSVAFRRDQMPHLGRPVAAVERARLLLDLAIGHRPALVLAQVLGPRFHEERLHEAPRLGRVLEYAPLHRAVAPPLQAELVHHAREVRG